MTIAEIAAQMGVTPETLVQEVILEGTTKATVWVALGTLLATGALIIGTFMLVAGAPDLIAWKTAPQTTANQYIVEHYGGEQNDD